jgi:flagellar biosynthesis/type III secretory pathway protein FliH
MDGALYPPPHPQLETTQTRHWKPPASPLGPQKSPRILKRGFSFYKEACIRASEVKSRRRRVRPWVRRPEHRRQNILTQSNKTARQIKSAARSVAHAALGLRHAGGFKEGVLYFRAGIRQQHRMIPQIRTTRRRIEERGLGYLEILHHVEPR